MMFFMKATEGNDAPAIKGALMPDRKKKREEKEKKRMEDRPADRRGILPRTRSCADTGEDFGQ